MAACVSADTIRSVSLLIPGLFGSALAGTRAWEGLSLPSLEQWLTRAEKREAQAVGLEGSVFELFGIAPHEHGDVPAAAVTRQWEKGDAAEGIWLRADPVHVRADRDRLVMLGNTLLTISADEQEQLASELGTLFQPDGLWLDAVNARRWYLRLPEYPQITTTALGDAIGQDVLHCMPRGTNARRWRSLLNEAQMILHGSSVNERRTAAGQLPVNSVWFWGGGALPIMPRRTWSHIWSNEAVSTSLAALAGVPQATLPADAGEFLENRIIGSHLVVLDGARERVQFADVEGWQAFLHAAHESWLAPLYDAVKRRRLDEIIIYPADGSSFRLATRAARRWWVRRRPLTEWI